MEWDATMTAAEENDPRKEQQQQQQAIQNVAAANNYMFPTASSGQLLQQQQQQQNLLQTVSQQILVPQQARPVAAAPPQVLQVPLPAMRRTLLVSPTTGALIGMEPFAANVQQHPQYQNVTAAHPQEQYQQQQQQQHPLIHNLIPEHLQASAFEASSLDGSPGYQPALVAAANHLIQSANPHSLGAVSSIPPTDVNAALQTLVQAQQQLSNATLPSLPAPLPLPPPPPAPVSGGLTVQDRFPMMPPIYNGVNPSYPGVQQVHANPPVFVVNNFLTPFECDFLIQAADDSWAPAPVVGKGAGEISPSRTSSTCYLAREDLPDYMRKISSLTSKPIEHCELPQVGRYLSSQQYLHHFDAFDLSHEDGFRFASNGGQRVVTVLTYLNDCTQGGQTEFPAINLRVNPRRGTALVFFPATVDGYLDKMALHAALPAVDVKYVSQVWIRQGNYYGQPSKRLQKTLGMPFDATGQANTLLGIQTPV